LAHWLNIKNPLAPAAKARGRGGLAAVSDDYKIRREWFIWCWLGGALLAGRWVDRAEQRNTNVVYAVSDKPMIEQEWVAEHVTELEKDLSGTILNRVCEAQA
jgi:hypothetical protein